MRLTFLGAAQQVTGSCTLIEHAGRRLLVDCGLFQERRFLERNWAALPVPARSIDTLLLTHGHLDHCGRIPLLVRQGFGGRILATPPSVDIARLVMFDSAHIQEEDAAYKAKRHAREGRTGRFPAQPLYEQAHAERAAELLRPVDFGATVDLGDGLSARFHEAGHILGSAMIELSDGAQGSVVFSGDLGQWDKPLVGDPTLLREARAVVMESTYGDREHREAGPVREQLARVITEAQESGGNVVIPTFAVERAQELLFHLAALRRERRIRPLPVFLDSPMAVNVTELFSKHRRYLDAESRGLLEAGRDPLSFSSLHLCRTAEQSKAINALQGGAVILAGAGMCTGGRIKHHLVNNLPRRNATILFVGYQSRDTLGGQIVAQQEEVRIFGRFHRVAARIRQVSGLSAHGDRSDLLRWLNGFHPLPSRVVLNHGEEAAMASLSEAVRSLGCEVVLPRYEQSLEV